MLQFDRMDEQPHKQTNKVINNRRNVCNQTTILYFVTVLI